MTSEFESLYSFLQDIDLTLLAVIFAFLQMIPILFNWYLLKTKNKNGLLEMATKLSIIVVAVVCLIIWVNIFQSNEYNVKEIIMVQIASYGTIVFANILWLMSKLMSIIQFTPKEHNRW